MFSNGEQLSSQKFAAALTDKNSALAQPDGFRRGAAAFVRSQVTCGDGVLQLPVKLAAQNYLPIAGRTGIKDFRSRPV
jgi:hypothetical protein